MSRRKPPHDLVRFRLKEEHAAGTNSTVHTRPDCRFIKHRNGDDLEVFEPGDDIEPQYNNSGVQIGPKWCKWCGKRTETRISTAEPEDEEAGLEVLFSD